MSIAQSNAQLSAQVTALTFIGNARSGLQQDAFAIGGDYYQTDLVPCDHWQGIDENTGLQNWLKGLKSKVYASQGNAYDNGTAVLVRF